MPDGGWRNETIDGVQHWTYRSHELSQWEFGWGMFADGSGMFKRCDDCRSCAVFGSWSQPRSRFKDTPRCERCRHYHEEDPQGGKSATVQHGACCNPPKERIETVEALDALGQPETIAGPDWPYGRSPLTPEQGDGNLMRTGVLPYNLSSGENSPTLTPQGVTPVTETPTVEQPVPETAPAPAAPTAEGAAVSPQKAVWTPELRQAMREKMTAYWSDPAKREAHRQLMLAKFHPEGVPAQAAPTNGEAAPAPAASIQPEAVAPAAAPPAPAAEQGRHRS